MRIWKNQKFWAAVQAVLIYVWLTDLSALAGTDTYYSVYVLCGALGLLCLWDNWKTPSAWKTPAAVWVFSGLFSLAVVLGNHELYEPLKVLQNLMNSVLDLLGGFCVGYQILRCLLRRLPLKASLESRTHPKRVFFLVFAAVAAVDLGFLFFAHYPGLLTTDSYSTIAQILDGNYNNTMPFWHTMLVRLFVQPGLALFGNLTDAVALYHCFQILMLAACFGYAVMTLYQVGVPKLALAAVFAVYALLPYNIVYSITLWKDIPFAAMVLLMVTAFYRLLKNVGKSSRSNYVFFAIGAAGSSLLRTNGWYAMLVVAACLAIAARKQYKKVLIILLAVLVVCWVMINPLLAVLNVPGTNMVEAFAVPMQQVARVVANDRTLTETENQLLSEIFWMDKLGSMYDPQTVDPVKFETFRYDQVDYIRENAGAYLKLYLSLGARYPGDYFKAWIDETRGYWNGGYFFWIYTLKMGSGELGLIPREGNNPIASLYAAWFRYAEKPTALQPLYSIGLHVWVLVVCCLVNALKKRKNWLLCLPPLVLIAGLWFGTPVYSEFRYAYPVFLSLPVILMATLFEQREREEQ